MHEERIEFHIKESGEITYETFGFQGETCAKEAERLMQAIGGTVVEDRKKPEYYEEGDNPVSILQQ